ncbi:conserved hypothetical protein [Leishmania braziliensis MHOM/BR/75/M2904]|uniref:Uncharacterized protein n=2 Tax=Leishmania braziliensis TaxID=5660 RepID=A4HIZ3_LEIBR|nr:conserved hypothetical protein [Leishmania braziliensis MHOM/BR/75/M2904]KAI5687815.1 hypothetical protein MNV84_06141 [Leishmania braziliensis]CAJ2477654.1 unnamed protein product [Leishmania braziliensis]CAM42449.1 conserved hypothetical protein [Leishmania braziliensis MHOM/BR/75/M2904]SYZ68214.1 hypothetical_protein [Leishmania braziliensis MHOM/BR/75/M2904]
METVLAFLEDTLLAQYVELLPSRWSALLPRLAKRTQQLQTLTDVTAVGGLVSALEDDFQHAAQLLHAEHGMYQEGVSLFDGLRQASELVQHTWRLLANDMLAELATKELILAHWKAAMTTISADTLRVYGHALLVHTRVTKPRVNHLIELARAAERS